MAYRGDLDALRARADAIDRGGDLCARFYRRSDGSLLSADCPVGVRRKRIRRIGIAAVRRARVATIRARHSRRSVIAAAQPLENTR